MRLSLQPQHLRRYKDIARLFLKYGRSDLVRRSGLDDLGVCDAPGERGNGSGSTAPPAQATELADDLEALGPTFIKLGQLLSTRSDLLPEPYRRALTRLQDDVEPFDFKDVQRIVNEDLGVRISKAFAEFEKTPLAAASLGQVHRARLRDGRHVAVKVQRPGVLVRVTQDLDSLGEIADFLDAHTEVGRRYEFQRILGELRMSLLAEIDYRREAQNLQTLRENLADFDRIIVPRPVLDYVSPRVLTMEYIPSRKITSLSQAVLIELDRTGLAEELSRAYLKQILVDGFFHADPHPGNVHLTDDHRLVLLDLGMVARVSQSLQESLVKLLLAISEGRGDDAARVGIEMADKREGSDEHEFRQRVAALVSRCQSARLEEIQVGRVVMEVHALATANGLRLPAEMSMIGKMLLNLDMVSRTLDPKFDPNASIRRNASDILQQRMRRKLTSGNFFNTVLEMSEFTQRLPDRLNRIMELVAANQLRLHVDAIDENKLIEGLQKIANRIAMGLVLAALIVGAALLMRVETAFTIFGYPGLAMLLFTCAVVGGIALVISIITTDRRANRSRQR